VQGLSEILASWKPPADELTYDQACQIVAWVFSREGREWTPNEVWRRTRQSDNLIFLWLQSCDMEIADTFGHA